MRPSTALAALLPASAAAIALPEPGALFSRVIQARGGGDVSQVSLPSSGLPAPAPGLALKYVALGLGTQNYTCKATPNDANAVPTSNGAKATLYDAVPVLSRGDPPVKSNIAQILPPLALSLSTFGLTPDHWPAPIDLKPIGHHFFSPALAPVFALDTLGKGNSPIVGIQCKKVANVPAPAGSCPGVKGEAPVDWLYLSDSGTGYGSGGPLAGGGVYRVETTGGSAPKSCAGQTGDVLVRYAAEYFFYGPA